MINIDRLREYIAAEKAARDELIAANRRRDEAAAHVRLVRDHRDRLRGRRPSPDVLDALTRLEQREAEALAAWRKADAAAVLAQQRAYHSGVSANYARGYLAEVKARAEKQEKAA